MTAAPRTTPASAKPIRATIWKRIYGRVGAHWKALALAGLTMAGAAATQPTLAILMKPLLDGGFSGAKPYYVWSLPLAVISLVLVRGLCTFCSDYVLSWVANNVLRDLRRDMFDRLLCLPDSDFKRGDTGLLLNRFTVETTIVVNSATEVATAIIREGL
ncbi:MAG TPA: ABC transporter transmembrane domain-containing protein, partial [Bordetella sp.]